MADPLQIALFPSATVSADGPGPVVDIGELRSLLRGSVFISSITGLATGSSVNAVIETSPDGVAGWQPMLSLRFTTPFTNEFTVDSLLRFCRLNWSLSGATIIASSDAESHVLYATRRDLRKKALPDVVDDDEDRDSVAECLLSATADAADALRVQFPGLAITGWPDSLRQRCASIARYRIFERVGFKPQGFDELIVKDHDDAQIWLRAVAARRIILSGITANMVEPTRVSFSRDCPDPPRRLSDNWGDY